MLANIKNRILNSRIDSKTHHKKYYRNMKKSIICILFSILIYNANAQEYKKYFDNGQIEVIGNFENGKKNGKWKLYNGNGQLVMIINYENGVVNDQWKSFHKNGQLKVIGNYEKEERNDEWKYYHENGKLEEIGNYEYGKRNGEWKSYFENGKLEAIGNYKNGKENGEWKYYYENGQLGEIGNFEYGIENGEWKYYYENGQLQEIGNYEYGKENGQWKKYDENGNLMQIETLPIFPGCEKGNDSEKKRCFSDKVQKHFSRKFNTDLAVDLGFYSGKHKIYAEFKITKTGDIEIIGARAPHSRLRKEAIRVVNILPKMTPGKHNGNPKVTTHTVTFSFTVD
ncbi:MAG: hypothetical protein COB60_12260 [Flavobacteriaceae bacterium]|nr:MAG: hypothetical protein COB60_12260 [Flavobacteriaceae bacterium]